MKYFKSKTLFASLAFTAVFGSSAVAGWSGEVEIPEPKKEVIVQEIKPQEPPKVMVETQSVIHEEYEVIVPQEQDIVYETIQVTQPAVVQQDVIVPEWTEISVVSKVPNAPQTVVQSQWSGGPDLVQCGPNCDTFDSYEFRNNKHPLALKAMPEDNGNNVLSLNTPYPGYAGMVESNNYYLDKDQQQALAEETNSKEYMKKSGVNPDAVVDNWVAKEGQTLKEVLTSWATEAGWTVIWSTDRSYPLKASAIFRGRFKDVSSAIIKGFSKINPPPYAQFYLGNKVMVIKTLGDDNG